MKTTKEDRDAIRLDADKAEESSIDWIRERGLRFRRVLSDLSRLAEIEAARGGLTGNERKRVAFVSHSSMLVEREVATTALRLDDALRAANEELARCRGMLRECLPRDALPALLDEVERLRSEIQSMREDCPERYWKCESCEMYFDPCDEGLTTEDGVNLCDKCAVAAMTEARDGR